jgi:hypothetical protein
VNRYPHRQTHGYAFQYYPAYEVLAAYSNTPSKSI